jgi:hypothetical protein
MAASVTMWGFSHAGGISPTRVVLPMQALQALTGNVRVNGGGGNVGMPQKHLDRP